MVVNQSGRPIDVPEALPETPEEISLYEGALRRHQHLADRQFPAFGKSLLDVAVYTTQPYEPVLLYGDTAFLGASEIKMLDTTPAGKNSCGSRCSACLPTSQSRPALPTK